MSRAQSVISWIKPFLLSRTAKSMRELWPALATEHANSMRRYRVEYWNECGYGGVMNSEVVFDAKNVEEARREFGNVVRWLGYSCTADTNKLIIGVRKVPKDTPLSEASIYRGKPRGPHPLLHNMLNVNVKPTNGEGA